MINQINKEIHLLRKIKKIAKNSLKVEDQLLTRAMSVFAPLLSTGLVSTLIYTKQPEDPWGAILFASVLLILFSLLISAALSGLVCFVNYLYKYTSIKNYPNYLKKEIKELSAYTFVKNEKIKKITSNVEQLNKYSHKLIEYKYLRNLSNEEIKKSVIKSIIQEDLSNEKLYSNLTGYFEEIKKSKLECKSYAYELLIIKILNNLDYEIFNNNKHEIIKCIDIYFNEYEQQKYLKKLKEIQEEFDSDVIKDNINKYKMDLLKENREIQIENKVLKSI